MDIHLTNEQAIWLEKYLGCLLDDRDWGRNKMGADEREHAETILNKIRDWLDTKKW